MSSSFSRETSLAMIRIMQDLPALPDRFARIQTILDDPKASAKDLADVIGTDQSTTLMILKCANSIQHNPMGITIKDIPHAIARLGIHDTSQIAMSMSLCYGFAMPMGMRHVLAFWAHAFATGLLSQHLAKQLHLNEDELFTAGLLHDIGRVMLGIRVDMGYFESELAVLHGDELVAAEQEIYGLDHAEAGAEILKVWGLPESMQEVVAGHHSLNVSTSIPAKICALANREANIRLPDLFANIEKVEQTIIPDFKPDAPEILREAGLLQ